MECIMEFLKDEYQGKLRKFAQGISERHEDTISSYKDIFIMHYNLAKSETSACKKCCDSYFCEEIRTVLYNISEDDITYFFDKVREIYLYWINSEPINSINSFSTLLNEYNLLSFTKKITNNQIFFKARNSDKILTRWDMFHIPFNKRYLIGNQRYSLTGQPMLYIGSSVLDVAKEIGVTDINNLKVSVVKLPITNFRIYELRHNILGLSVEYAFKYLSDDESPTYNQSLFFKMILSSLCSFQKKSELNGYSFCEEYVIPQIFALILKQNNFNGISYISTKKYNDIDNINSNGNDYKENIAIFTNSNSNHVYDHELYDKINISVPIDINKIDDISLDDIIELCNEINLTHIQEKINRSEIIYNSYIHTYSNIKIDNIDYSESTYGKIHLYELYTVLNQILVSK